MGLHRRFRLKIVLILLAAVLLGAAAGIYFYVRHLAGNTNYIKDEDVAIAEAATEQESDPPVTAASLYDLSGVKAVTPKLLENTYTLLVIGGEDPSAGDTGDIESASEHSSRDSEEAGNTESASESLTGTSGNFSETNRQSTSENTSGRTDAEAVILMTINHNIQEVFFTSFNTGLYVEIPGCEPGSLGSAFALGGGPLLQKTVELNYGIPSDNYASISLKEVARIIEMPEFETIDISRDGVDVVEELVYSMNAKNPAQVAGYIQELLPYVTHNIDDGTMLRLILQIPKIIPYYSTKAMVPFDGTWQEADGYLVADAAATAERIQDMCFPQAAESAESESR